MFQVLDLVPPNSGLEILEQKNLVKNCQNL